MFDSGRHPASFEQATTSGSFGTGMPAASPFSGNPAPGPMLEPPAPAELAPAPTSHDVPGGSPYAAARESADAPVAARSAGVGSGLNARAESRLGDTIRSLSFDVHGDEPRVSRTIEAFVGGGPAPHEEETVQETRLAAEIAAGEREAAARREVAEREAAERVEREERERVEREAAERFEREIAERVERELAVRAERARAARQLAEREAAELADRVRAEREAAEQAERETAAREAAELAAAQTEAAELATRSLDDLPIAPIMQLPKWRAPAPAAARYESVDPTWQIPLVDSLTGLASRVAWETALADEQSRFVRYRRPTAVIVAELVGLDRLVERFGLDAVDRIVPAVADTFRHEGRACDQIARLGDTRFAVLLPETDELQANHYVERVRLACDRWLQASGVRVRLLFGIASPPVGADLDRALRAAEERLWAERRRVEAYERDEHR